MQNKITNRTPLFNNDGTLTKNVGYAYQMMYDYDNSLITSSKFRIKEWDFYQFNDENFAVQLTIGHVGYAGTCACTLFEFATGKRWEKIVPLLYPMKKLNLPFRTDEEHTVRYKNKNFEMYFDVKKGSRHLFVKGNKVDIDVEMKQPHNDGMVILVPFDNPRQFYLNHKINCMPTTGVVKIKDKEVHFKDALGLIDWGRGVWPYHQEWWWGNGSALVDGVPFGFNVGWGFGNPVTTENMLFYDGKGSKLEGVKAEVDTNDYMKPWKFYSSDNRFEMEFTPTFDNYTSMNLVFVKKYCHQVFGKFNGIAKTDDGQTIEVKDMFAFCEHACNWW